MRPLSFRPLFILLPASLWLLPAAQSNAQSTAHPATDVTTISTVQVPPPPTAAKFSDADIDEVSGIYAMSNGWRLKVEPASRGIVARIDRQRPIRLHAVTPTRYVSRDGNVSMDFDVTGNDNQLRMSYIPAGALASERIVLTTTLAQR